MKNIKWHKTFIITLLIWLANSIYMILKPTISLKRLAIVGFGLFLITLISCGSTCKKTKRYWRKHRCVEVPVNKEVIPIYKTSGKIAKR